MRPEKKYLVEEVGAHLDKSDYVILADYNRITVEETAELRNSLRPHRAEFHVIKNSVLDVAARKRDLPDLSSMLDGPTAVVLGGDDAPGVAKVLGAFFKKFNKIEVKGGVLANKKISPDDVQELAKLPTMDVLRAQLLALFQTPATQLARVLQATPESILNVLQRRAEQEN